MKVSITFAYYELDPVGFIEALCENKDQPELQCNGKCQLKKVSETQDKEQKTPENIIDFKELLLYTNPTMDFNPLNQASTNKQQLTIYQNLYFFQNTNDCFHPPRV